MDVVVVHVACNKRNLVSNLIKASGINGGGTCLKAYLFLGSLFSSFLLLLRRFLLRLFLCNLVCSVVEAQPVPSNL